MSRLGAVPEFEFMPIIEVALPARDSVEARALLFRSFKALITDCLAVAATSGHARSFRNDALRTVDVVQAAAAALYPGDRDVQDELAALVLDQGLELSARSYAGRYAVRMKPKPPAGRMHRNEAGEQPDARATAAEAPSSARCPDRRGATRP